MSEFKKPYTVAIGGKGMTRLIEMGGNSPLTIQTMWKSSLIGADIENIARTLGSLSLLGCDIVRFAVPDMESANVLVRLAAITAMPLVADIHFDYRLALRCMDGNVAKIRINPGNIGSRNHVKAVVDKARATDTAIRIGVNSGSLPKDLQERVESVRLAGGDGVSARAEALAETASREAALFDELGFTNMLVSMKASSVAETVRCNEAFARSHDIPLHIGVTEAGPVISGVVKSTLAFSKLLAEGIGSTIRVSLSDTMENEVIAGREILTECGKRTGGVRIVSCPRCGRNGFDVHGFVSRWQNELLSMNKNITVAVMGCVVNGPGEGKHADIGITGSGDKIIIFRHGETVRTVSVSDGIEISDAAFREELFKTVKNPDVQKFVRTSFCVVLLFSGAVSFAKSLDDIDTWKKMDEANELYEKGDFGAALQSCENARLAHEARVISNVDRLKKFLEPATIRKAGDDIGAVRAAFTKRNEDDALDIIDRVLLNHPASQFDNSISKMIDWLEKQKVYPESDFLSGRIYEAEGENSVAFSFYEKAWSNRDYFDIPDDRFVLAFRMADLSRDSGNRGMQEKYLLLILEEDDLYGKPGAESPTLLAMMHTLETEKTVDKFFSLYRHSNKVSMKACRDLAAIYLVNNRIDRAFPVAIISACSAVTALSDTVAASDFSFEYDSISNLMIRAGKNGNIARWAHENGIWDSFLILAAALDAHGQKAQALSLWSVIAQSCPDPVASRRAAKAISGK